MIACAEKRLLIKEEIKRKDCPEILLVLKREAEKVRGENDLTNILLTLLSWIYGDLMGEAGNLGKSRWKEIEEARSIERTMLGKGDHEPLPLPLFVSPCICFFSLSCDIAYASTLP